MPAIHAVRCAVRENALSDPTRVTEASYPPYIAARSAWVATKRGSVAGFAILDQASNSVWALFVHPEHEGAGIGRALHDAMLDEARRRAMSDLWLVTATDTRAERFYHDAGWVSAAAVRPGETRFKMSLKR